MTDRIRRMMNSIVRDNFPVCISKFKTTCRVITETNGLPIITRRAKLLAALLDEIPIYILDDELMVGGGASKPGALEVDADYGAWDEEEIAALRADGFTVDPEDEKELLELYKTAPPFRTYIGGQYDAVAGNDELYSFLLSGMISPPWKSKRGPGGGMAQSGYGLGPGFQLMSVDYDFVLSNGLNKLIEIAQEKLHSLKFYDKDSVEQSYTYQAMIESMEALKRFSKRFAALAEEMAEKEERPQRKKELLEIADTCRWIPDNPPRTFRDAVQFFWFIFQMVTPSPTACIGRFDQYMYPYYKADIEAGRITNEEVIELLEMIRIRDYEFNRIYGKEGRKKNNGYAKWHNMTIGGVKRDGSDATNELSYLILDAVMDTKLPHHTVTLRVADSTPKEIMLKALECLKAGCSMPAFISDNSYIAYFVNGGMPIEDARNYCPAGCLDAEVPGKTRTTGCTMFNMPMTINMFFDRGVNRRTGLKFGLDTGDVTRFATWEEFYGAYKVHLQHYMDISAQNNNMRAAVMRDIFPCPIRSAFIPECLENGEDFHRHEFQFENAIVMNPVGMVNAANSLYAVKKLVFEDKVTTLSELKAAMDANWAGYEDLQKKCRECDKYGNDVSAVDEVLADLYKFWHDETVKFPAVFGGHQRATALSITAHYPAGQLSYATPDGRNDGEMLADGCASPVQGSDHNGPLSMLNSALRINMDDYQTMLLNMKLHPTALKTVEDMEKVAAMIRTYLTNGGKHIQFNVTDKEQLEEAQREPELHKDLMVRVAGYSAYFVYLNDKMQKELIDRTENRL